MDIESISSNCWNMEGMMTAVVGPVRGPAEPLVAPVGFKTAREIDQMQRAEKAIGMMRHEKESITLNLP